MRNFFQAIICVIFISACSNNYFIDKPKYSYLDSLVNFEEIKEIYLYTAPPINYEEISVSDSIIIIHELLLEDSLTLKWTDSKQTIEEFSRAFPKFSYPDDLNWDTINNSFNELLIVTKDTMHVLGWMISDEESLFGYDDEVFNINKRDLKAATDVLDRKIVTKEIYKRDLGKYSLNDRYNKHYLNRFDSLRPRQDKMFIYILK